jgi:hypothetical protein
MATKKSENLEMPLIQIDDEVRPMTQQEYQEYLDSLVVID